MSWRGRVLGARSVRMRTLPVLWGCKGMKRRMGTLPSGAFFFLSLLRSVRLRVSF